MARRAATVVVKQGRTRRPRSTWTRRRRLLNACTWLADDIDLRGYVRGIERVIARGDGGRWRTR